MIGTGLSNVFCSAAFWSKSAQLSVQLFYLLVTSFALGTPNWGKCLQTQFFHKRNFWSLPTVKEV